MVQADRRQKNPTSVIVILAGWIFAVVVLAAFGCAPRQVDQPTSPVDTPAIALEPEESDAFIEARQRLTAHAVRVQNLQNEDVIRALGTVPRHRFVPENLVENAYQDTALPIGYGQTISQPSLVALMTELLDLNPGERVLEIGTGSGYQAAILAELGYVEVYSIEIVPELHEQAAEVLSELGYAEVKTMAADGYYGWEEFAPFDAIIVTAAPDHMPAPLAEQLAEGGVMVIPIGPPGFTQTLWKFIKQEGELSALNMGSVRFVPFTGEGIEGQ